MSSQKRFHLRQNAHYCVWELIIQLVVVYGLLVMHGNFELHSYYHTTYNDFERLVGLSKPEL
jgi:hypothetical protein